MKTIPPHFPESDAPLHTGITLYWATTPSQLRRLADQMEDQWTGVKKAEGFDPRATHVLATYRNGHSTLAVCVDQQRIDTPKRIPPERRGNAVQRLKAKRKDLKQ